MSRSENKISLLASLKSNSITAIEQYAADSSFYIRSLARTIAQDSSVFCYVFSLAEGLKKIAISQQGEDLESTDILTEPNGADPLLHYLEEYYSYSGEGIFIFQDLHQFLKPPVDRAVASYLRAIATHVKRSDSFKRLILLGQEIELSNELIRLIPIIRNSLPNAEQRQAALTQKFKQLQCFTPVESDNLIQSTSGLTIREIYNRFDYYYQQSVYRGRDPNCQELIDQYVEYKTKLLRSLKVEVSQPRIHNFGGHGALKQWLIGIKAILNPEARSYGIPFPKGCLLGGVSGVGKTLIAESISSEWCLPLIKLSIPALKGSLVGESETNLKRALDLISSVRGVLLIDEIEKAIAGAGTDSSGVTGGMLSILLDYMNSQSQHFIICTANDVTQIPAELMRKGRLDEVWFAGLPNVEERAEILKIHFFQQNRVAEDWVEAVEDFIPTLAERTIDFSGAELAALVTQGLTDIYLDGRATRPQSRDFIPLASTIIPLAAAQPEQYQKVLQWSQKARNTSNYETNAHSLSASVH